MHPTNLAKGPLLVTKWAKNGVFVAGLRAGGGSKSPLFGSKRSILGVLHPPDLILAMGLVFSLSFDVIKLLAYGSFSDTFSLCEYNDKIKMCRLCVYKRIYLLSVKNNNQLTCPPAFNPAKAWRHGKLIFN